MCASAEFRKHFQSRSLWSLSLILAPNLSSKSNPKRKQFTCHYFAFQQYATAILVPPMQTFRASQGGTHPVEEPRSVSVSEIEF